MIVRRTIDAYDQVAAEYKARWHNRAVMDGTIDRFAAHLHPDALVLDVGSGPGNDAVLLRRHGLRVVALDLSWGMIQAGRADFGGPFVQADMRRLPLAPRTAQGLWINASLLHLPRREAGPALHRLRSVLKPGGVLYLGVKEGAGEGWSSGAYGTDAARYFTYWTESTLDELLVSAGFSILEAWTTMADPHPWLARIAAA